MRMYESQQQAAFDRIKQLVTSRPVLKVYDVIEDVTLQNDASEKRLGAALLHNGQLVAFASRARAEQNYAQIEKECLAILLQQKDLTSI